MSSRSSRFVTVVVVVVLWRAFFRNTDLSTNLPIWFTVSLCAEGCPFSLRD